MNKLEGRYAVHLAELKMVGEIREWGFERVKLKLAPATFFTPDFDVITLEGYIDLIDCKGWAEDDARVKVKCAAVLFPHFGFVSVTWDKLSSSWVEERFTP